MHRIFSNDPSLFDHHVRNAFFLARKSVIHRERAFSLRVDLGLLNFFGFVHDEL